MQVALGPLTIVQGGSLKTDQPDEVEELRDSAELPAAVEDSEASSSTPDSLSKEDQEAVLRLVNAIKKEHRRKRVFTGNAKNVRRLQALDHYEEQQTPVLETEYKGRQFNRAA